jgi:hypothetical protein
VAVAGPGADRRAGRDQLAGNRSGLGGRGRPPDTQAPQAGADEADADGDDEQAGDHAQPGIEALGQDVLL